MDYSERANVKGGSGGVADDATANAQRRHRVAKLLASQINLDNDPYIFKNHLGLLECKLCLTTHVLEASTYSHLQGRKHQLNLLRRSDDKQGPAAASPQLVPKRQFTKIGKPAFTLHKTRHPVLLRLGLRCKVLVPDIKEATHPYHRFMSVYEHEDSAPAGSANHQFLVVSAEPYENIAFQIPAVRVEEIQEHYDQDTKEYFLQFQFQDQPM